jgi:hypothetical protein
MKAMLILAPAFLALAASLPQKKQEDFGLPELHKIKTITLSPSYSCQPKEEFHRGSMSSALFLSAFSHQNGPELLFNGACGAEDNFQGISGGDYVGVIADLGEMPLEKLTSHLIFNTKNIASFDLYSRFAQSVKVQAGHTYAVLVSSPKVRGMFAFTVTGYVPNKKVDLNYVVKEYQILELKAESPGFDWATENTM